MWMCVVFVDIYMYIVGEIQAHLLLDCERNSVPSEYEMSSSLMIYRWNVEYIFFAARSLLHPHHSRRLTCEYWACNTANKWDINNLIKYEFERSHLFDYHLVYVWTGPARLSMLQWSIHRVMIDKILIFAFSIITLCGARDNSFVDLCGTCGPHQRAFIVYFTRVAGVWGERGVDELIQNIDFVTGKKVIKRKFMVQNPICRKLLRDFGLAEILVNHSENMLSFCQLV